MKYLSWSEEIHELLKAERQVSFEDVVFYIQMGFLLDALDNPNQEKYKGQKHIRCANLKTMFTWRMRRFGELSHYPNSTLEV